MYPGEAIALQPEPIDCALVLLPRAVDSPYSYQYEVGDPFGVTFPVTTAVEFEGATAVLVITSGALADVPGSTGTTVTVPSALVMGVLVAVGVPGIPAFELRRR